MERIVTWKPHTSTQLQQALHRMIEIVGANPRLGPGGPEPVWITRKQFWLAFCDLPITPDAASSSGSGHNASATAATSATLPMVRLPLELFNLFAQQKPKDVSPTVDTSVEAPAPALQHADRRRSSASPTHAASTTTSPTNATRRKSSAVSPSHAAPAIQTDAHVTDNFEADTSNTASLLIADGILIIIAAAIFCEGVPGLRQEGLQFIFGLFGSLEGEGSLSMDALRHLIICVNIVAAAVGAVPRTAHTSRINDFVTTLAMEHPTAFTMEEYLMWLQELDLLEQLRQLAQLTAKPAPITRKVSHAPLAQPQANKQSRKLLASASIMHTVLKRKMQAASALRVASAELLTTLSRTSHFTMDELRQLREHFANTVPAGERGALTRAQFRKVLVAFYPRLLSNISLIDRLFDCFDADGNGTVDFQEFVLGLSKMSYGNVEDKVGLMFDMIDHRNMGAIRLAELSKLVTRENGMFDAAGAYVGQLLQTIDSNRDGYVSRKEFIKGLATEPALLELLTTSVLAGFDGLRGPFEQCTPKDTFTLPTLRKLWTSYSQFGENGTLDVTKFRKFMFDELKCPRDSSAIISAMFQVLDVEHSGSVDCKQMFLQLGKLVRGSAQQKADFLFDLFDTDGSGSLDEQEIMRMLALNSVGADVSTRAVRAALSRMDTNGDGYISKDEFINACNADQGLRGTFARIFGVQDSETRSQTADRHLVSQINEIASLIRAGHDSEYTTGGNLVAAPGRRRSQAEEGIARLRAMGPDGLAVAVRTLDHQRNFLHDASDDVEQEVDAILRDDRSHVSVASPRDTSTIRGGRKSSVVADPASFAAKFHGRSLAGQQLPGAVRSLKHDIVTIDTKMDRIMHAELEKRLAQSRAAAFAPAVLSTSLIAAPMKKTRLPTLPKSASEVTFSKTKDRRSPILVPPPAIQRLHTAAASQRALVPPKTPAYVGPPEGPSTVAAHLTMSVGQMIDNVPLPEIEPVHQEVDDATAKVLQRAARLAHSKGKRQARRAAQHASAVCPWAWDSEEAAQALRTKQQQNNAKRRVVAPAAVGQDIVLAQAQAQLRHDVLDPKPIGVSHVIRGKKPVKGAQLEDAYTGPDSKVTTALTKTLLSTLDLVRNDNAIDRELADLAEFDEK